MRQRNEYLSDEELELLVSRVEENDLVAAPPDMKERIVSGIAEEGSGVREGQQKKEFWNYCFRVWTSVAAAIFILFLLGAMPDKKSETNLYRKANETGIFEEYLGGSRIFDREDSLKLFTARNGG